MNKNVLHTSLPFPDIGAIPVCCLYFYFFHYLSLPIVPIHLAERSESLLASQPSIDQPQQNDINSHVSNYQPSLPIISPLANIYIAMTTKIDSKNSINLTEMLPTLPNAKTLKFFKSIKFVGHHFQGMSNPARPALIPRVLLFNY